MRSYSMILVANVLLLLPLVLSVAISDVFILKAGTTGGGCDNYIDGLNNYLAECITLVDSALTAINNYGTDDIARKSLASYFAVNPSSTNPNKPATPSILAEVRTFYNDLRDLFAGNFEFETGEPHFFCNSDWLIQKQASEQAQDEHGDFIFNVNGSPRAIRDVEEYKKALRPKKGQLQFPYWSPDLKGYYFDEDYPSHTFCGNINDLGVTTEGVRNLAAILPAVVTLCPQAFTARGGTARLGDTVPTDGRPLQDCQCQSLTLLHEAVHLTQTNGRSPDAAYGVAPSLNLVQTPNGGRQARRNPDSYVYFALSYWYSQQTFQANSKWQFINGLAVREQ